MRFEDPGRHPALLIEVFPCFVSFVPFVFKPFPREPFAGLSNGQPPHRASLPTGKYLVA